MVLERQKRIINMHPFQVIMIVSITALLLSAALFLIIRTMPSRKGIGWWIAAGLLQASIYLLALFSFGAEQTAEGTATFFVLQLLVNEMLAIGTLLFCQKQTNVKGRLSLAVGAAIIVASLVLGGYEFIGTLVFVSYNAMLFISVGSSVFRVRGGGYSLRIAGALIFLMGVHWLDYPFLKDIEWLAPIGFLVAMFLLIGLFLNLSLLSLLQFKKQTKESEYRAIQAAIHDPLTGLYNRSHLESLFAEYASQSDKTKSPFLLMYLDLDGFKAVNDTYGHKAGDAVLIETANRIKQWLAGRGDVVRIGGDELVVINRLRSDFKDSIIYGTSAALSLLEIIEQPITAGDQEFNISSSIGGCYYMADDKGLEEMLTQADKLMYSAKQAGGRRIHFSDAFDYPQAAGSAYSEVEASDSARLSFIN